MINVLYDINNNILSDIISEALITPDIIKIKNRLLDGTYHIQSIGNAVKNINIICYITETNKKIIEDIYIQNSPLKFTRDGMFYIGIIIESPDIQAFFKGTHDIRLYTAKFILNVQTEGVEV